MQPTTAPALDRLPPGLVTLADHEAAAHARLDANAWAYFSGGAGDEITLRANRAAWDALALVPRVLRPLAGGHTRVELLGRALQCPILLAPVAYQRMAHADGESVRKAGASAPRVLHVALDEDVEPELLDHLVQLRARPKRV